MMERIGNHLSSLSEHATGTTVSQNLNSVQQVCLIASLCFTVCRLIVDTQAHVGAYCDLVDFYVKVQGLFVGKVDCNTAFRKVVWEPFEAQFQSIETRFIYHADIVRLANAEHQLPRLPYMRDKANRSQEGMCHVYSVP